MNWEFQTEKPRKNEREDTNIIVEAKRKAIWSPSLKPTNFHPQHSTFSLKARMKPTNMNIYYYRNTLSWPQRIQEQLNLKWKETPSKEP